MPLRPFRGTGLGSLAEPPRDKVKELTEEIARTEREIVCWAIAVVLRPNPDHAAHDRRLKEAVELHQSLIERRKDACDHPNAFPVSSPRTGITEFRCDDCDSYFTQDNNEKE